MKASRQPLLKYMELSISSLFRFIFHFTLSLIVCHTLFIGRETIYGVSVDVVGDQVVLQPKVLGPFTTRNGFDLLFLDKDLEWKARAAFKSKPNLASTIYVPRSDSVAFFVPYGWENGFIDLEAKKQLTLPIIATYSGSPTQSMPIHMLRTPENENKSFRWNRERTSLEQSNLKAVQPSGDLRSALYVEYHPTDPLTCCVFETNRILIKQGNKQITPPKHIVFTIDNRARFLPNTTQLIFRYRKSILSWDYNSNLESIMLDDEDFFAWDINLIGDELYTIGVCNISKWKQDPLTKKYVLLVRKTDRQLLGNYFW